jgi:hypothetical protein
MPLPLDHTKATATISFAGLLLFRVVGPDNNQRCEVKVLDCDKHTLDLTIEEISLDNDGQTALRSRLVEHELDLKQDIQIEVKASSAPGIELCENAAQNFDRRLNQGDDEDIRWLLDFENNELNDQPVVLEAQANAARRKVFQPTISMNHCKLYTRLKTDEFLAREDTQNPDTDRVFLGQAALRVGADLLCEVGSEIVLSNSGLGATAKVLPQKPDTQYRITIENDCEIPNDFGTGSDFQFYYDALSTANNQKFDLRRVVDRGDAEALENDRLINAPANFASDNFPRSCIPGGTGTS